MKTPIRFATLTATALIMAASLAPHAAHATGPTALGSAQGYNVFVFGNLSQNGSDIQGKTAVGGNATFNSTTLALEVGVDNSIDTIVGGTYTNSGNAIYGGVAVGNANISGGSYANNVSAVGSITTSGSGNFYGNVKYGTTFTNPGMNVSGTTTQGATTLGVNFADTKTYFQGSAGASYHDGVAYQLGQLTPAGTLSTDYGHLLFSSAGSQNVFNITTAQLAGTNQIDFSGGANDVFIVNVLGSSASTPYTTATFSNGANKSNVLFNFVNATSLNIQGSFEGSALAAYADVTLGSGAFNGELIASSISSSSTQFNNGGGTSNSWLFTGNVTGLPSHNIVSAVPEPSAYVTTLTLCGLLGMAMVRGRRRTANAATIPLR